MTRISSYFLVTTIVATCAGCISSSREWNVVAPDLVLTIMPAENAIFLGSPLLLTERLVNVGSQTLRVDLVHVSRMVSPSILAPYTGEPTSFPQNMSYESGNVRSLAPGESMKEQYSFDAPPCKYSIQATWHLLLQYPGEAGIRRCTVRSDAVELHIPPVGCQNGSGGSE